MVAGRMTALAKAACAEIEEKQLSLEPASLFSSPLDDFDLIIHLRPDLIGKKSKAKKYRQNGVSFKNLELDLEKDDSKVGFDPTSDFLNELENVYGASIVFFSGGHERPVIAGLWHPQTAPRAWKLNLTYSAVPKQSKGEDGVQAVINKEAILAEIARLGGDMIERIETNRS